MRNGESREQFNVIPVNRGTSLIEGGGASASEIVTQATASIKDTLASMNTQIAASVAELKETMKGTEAAFSADHEMQVVLKSDQIIFTVKQSMNFQKDR